MTMAKALKVPFAKFHGLGNDFLVVRGQSALAPLAAFARAITARHTGLGADGLVVIMPPRGRSNDARARFFNADGSEAEMSGNGIRCAAAFLGGERGSKRVIRIETGAGVRPVRSVGRLEPAKGGTSSVFEVGMGEPILDGPKIPFKAGDFPSPIVGFQLRTERGLLPVTVTSMGNPHCTVLVADFDSFDWPRLGREIERNPLFPRRTKCHAVHAPNTPAPTTTTSYRVDALIAAASYSIPSGTAISGCPCDRTSSSSSWFQRRKFKPDFGSVEWGRRCPPAPAPAAPWWPAS